MLEKELAKKVKEIELPKDMRERIRQNCKIEMEEKFMSKNKVYRFSKKSIVTAASLVLCLGITSVTVLAATGKLKGFFKDEKRWDGAVVGTSYEQATDEINVNVIDVTEQILLEVKFVNPEMYPYKEFETLSVGSYKIVDVSGKVFMRGSESDWEDIVEGKVTINIATDDFVPGEYKLIVEEFVGSKKADQPLVMSGTWECEFSR